MSQARPRCPSRADERARHATPSSGSTMPRATRSGPGSSGLRRAANSPRRRRQRRGRRLRGGLDLWHPPRSDERRRTFRRLRPKVRCRGQRDLDPAVRYAEEIKPRASPSMKRRGLRGRLDNGTLPREMSAGGRDAFVAKLSVGTSLRSSFTPEARACSSTRTSLRIRPPTSVTRRPSGSLEGTSGSRSAHGPTRRPARPDCSRA